MIPSIVSWMELSGSASESTFGGAAGMPRPRPPVVSRFVVSVAGFALLPAVLTGWDVNLRYQAVACSGLLRLMGVPVGSARAANIENISVGFSVKPQWRTASAALRSSTDATGRLAAEVTHPIYAVLSTRCRLRAPGSSSP